MGHVESSFQNRFVNRLRKLYPGCVILKNDPNHLQGVPDILLLWRERWATFEIKASGSARVQPNQQYYVELMNEMSFSAFVYPENEESVLDELQRSFGPNRTARVSKRQQVPLGQLRSREADRGLA
jgi:hypothetical protein